MKDCIERSLPAAIVASDPEQAALQSPDQPWPWPAFWIMLPIAPSPHGSTVPPSYFYFILARCNHYILVTYP